MTNPDSWQPIVVTLRSADRRVKPHEVEGFVPFHDCPLAINPTHSHNSHDGWRAKGNEWNITHRPTGFDLGDVCLKSREEVEQLLLAANPSFFGWTLATGYHDDPATNACRVWFRAACAVMGIEVGKSVRA